MFSVDAINIVLVMVFLVNTIYGLVVYSRNRTDATNKIFFILTLTVTFWIVSMIAYRGFNSSEIVLTLARLLYFAALIIPITFIYFVSIFPASTYRFSFVEKYLLPIPFVVLAVISLIPNLFIQDVTTFSDREHVIIFNTGLHYIYGFYIAGYFLIAHSILFKKYLSAKGVLKSQLLSILIGTIIASIFGVVSNLILLLFFDYFTLNWLGQVGIIGMIVPIFYSIVKYKLFNIKVIATESLVFALWVFTLIKTFASVSIEDQIINILLLILVTIIGYFLIKSVRKEVESREKIEQLASDLEKTNTSLEKANDRLKELDQLKSEFVSLATHQIRAPLTAIRGYISMLKEGDYGPVSDEVSGTLDIISESANNLVTIVGDFLDVSRIEQGRMKYEMKDFDLNKLISQIVTEYQPNIEKKKLQFSFEADPHDNYTMYGDPTKVKQVIGNIIDNSVKYTPKGSVKVTLTEREGKFLVKISDTGVGIPPQTIPKLFQKFTRAENANEANILGTGLGLYVAKQMVEAHKGRIWAESEGNNKGSQFYIEFPAKV